MFDLRELCGEGSAVRAMVDKVQNSRRGVGIKYELSITSLLHVFMTCGVFVKVTMRESDFISYEDTTRVYIAADGEKKRRSTKGFQSVFIMFCLHLGVARSPVLGPPPLTAFLTFISRQR